MQALRWAVLVLAIVSALAFLVLAVLALSRDNQADPQQGNFYNPVDSSSYDLAATGAVTRRTLSDNGLTFTMAALTPDGSMALTSAVPPSTWSPFIEHGVYSPTGFPSSPILSLNTANPNSRAIRPRAGLNSGLMPCRATTATKSTAKNSAPTTQPKAGNHEQTERPKFCRL